MSLINKIITSLLLLLSLSVCAQQIPNQILKSEIFKDEYKESSIVYADQQENGGIIMVRSYEGSGLSNNRGYYLEKYDSNLKLLKEFDYPLKYETYEKYGTILGIVKSKETIQIIDIVYNINEKAFICSAAILDIDQPKASKKELFRLSREEIKKYGTLSLTDSFYNKPFIEHTSDSKAPPISMITNEKKDAFAIIVNFKVQKAETLKMFLFDNTLNKKLEHVYTRDIKERKFFYENMDISKDGNTLYLLAKIYSDEKKSKKFGGPYQYELTRFTADGEKTQVFDTDEHFVASLTTIASDNKIICVGFYSDRNENRYKGISYFELDAATLDIRKSKFNPFSQQFLIDKYGEESDKELKNLVIRKIHMTAKNEIILNAEEFYIASTPATMNGGGSHTFFIYDDIVSAKITNTGELAWARNINKSQSTGSDEMAHLSYTSTIKNDDTYFFINAAEKIKKLDNNRIQFNSVRKNKSNMNIIRISQNGDFEYQEILNNEENEVPFMVSEGIINNNSVFFLGKKGKNKQLLKVTL